MILLILSPAGAPPGLVPAAELPLEVAQVRRAAGPFVSCISITISISITFLIISSIVYYIMLY